MADKNQILRREEKTVDDCSISTIKQRSGLCFCVPDFPSCDLVMIQ